MHNCTSLGPHRRPQLRSTCRRCREQGHMRCATNYKPQSSVCTSLAARCRCCPTHYQRAWHAVRMHACMLLCACTTPHAAMHARSARHVCTQSPALLRQPALSAHDHLAQTLPTNAMPRRHCSGIVPTHCLLLLLLPPLLLHSRSCRKPPTASSSPRPQPPPPPRPPRPACAG